LDQIRKEAKAANRAPHLKKKHMPGADSIDSLDLSMLGGPYHHEGPYDATLLARNTSFQSSPVAAVRDSNREALRATPRENIRDALDKHVPLQGTAVIPPGMSGIDGRTMQYEEGADLMREPDAAGGAYKRWDHVVSHSAAFANHYSQIIEISPRRLQGKRRAVVHYRKGLERS
jgi:hypothetical protein